MPRLFINHETKTNTNDGLSSVIDTYADAILRTFASLKPPPSITSITSRKYHHNHSHSPLSTVINDCLDNQLILSETSSLSSFSSSINQNHFTLETKLPLVITKSESLKRFKRFISRLDKIYHKKKMSTKTLLPSSSSSHITDRYFFRSYSHNTKKTRLSSKNKFDDTTSPLLRKRYKFSSTNTEPYNHNNIYKFPTNKYEKRSHSIDSDRYYFPLDNSIKNSQQTLTYIPKSNNFEQHSMTFMDGRTSTCISDTPYLFSKTTETQQYPSTTSTYIHSQDKSTYQKILDGVSDSSLHTSIINPNIRQTKRLDTVTSTNGSLSKIKRSRIDKIPIVHFETPTSNSSLNEPREFLCCKQYDQSTESFDKSVDRLVSSVNKKYGQQQQQQQQQQMISSPSNSSTLNYISQYYIKDDQTLIDYPFDIDDEQKKNYYNLNTNRTHTQIMKNLNKSLIDHDYQIDKNRLKSFQQNVRRCLRSYENQSLQRELNYDLLRCFSSSYLDDLKRENIRYNHIRNNIHSYTYEDIQDIHVPSMLEVYKMKINIDREKIHRLQLSITTEPLSSVSSSDFSPVMIGSFNDNLETQSTGFETDRKSYTSISQPVTNIRANVDIFYEIMQESFLGIDASIAGHVSKATQFKKEKSHQYHRKPRNTDSDIDILTYSSIWSDDDDELDENQYHLEKTNQKQINRNQRKISRYLSTVNRSLLDRPSDLIADFYLSQLNRNMQDSVRHIEIIARDKAHKHEFIYDHKNKLERSLSAEHLYQVRKEHIRYKQSFKTPTSFTTEDVTDIYKPFVLENYKRKIAIELERRRRVRQEQFHFDLSYPSISNTDIDLTNNLIKYSHPPIINIDQKNQCHHHDFLTVSPSNIVQTKEIIMGRARRLLIDDGTDEIIQHVGVISPPPIYSIFIPSSSSAAAQRNLALTTMINNQHEIPHITTIDPPDFIDRKQFHIRQEEDTNDGILDNVLSIPQQGIISHYPHRPKTKLYTYITHSKANHISHAKQIESDSINKKISTITIKPIITLNRHEVNQFNEFLQQTQHLQIPQNNYQNAMLISTTPPLSLAVQSNNEQITQYIEPKQKFEHSTLTILKNEHFAVIQGEIPIFENVQTANLSLTSNTFVNNILSDNDDISLHICQRNKQPIILNSSHINTLESYDEQDGRRHKTLLNEETRDIDEQLPEYERVTITNEIAYVDPLLQPLNIQIFDECVPLASLLEESNTTTIHKQYAKQIIDDNHNWKTYEKVKENIRIPIIIDDQEWIDENIEIISNEFQSNIENAQHKYTENIKYEQIKINLPQQYTTKSIINDHKSNELFEKSFEQQQQQQVFDYDEQALSLLDDSYLIRYQQQANIHIDERPNLENPIHSQTILTLNYPYYNYKHSYKNFQQQEKKIITHNETELIKLSSDHIEEFSIDSQISSFIDMEIFLNHFEECLDHEQHLPLIDQISISYATTNIKRCEQTNRTLPIEWFKSTTIQSQDEQLVEQWTVEKDIDTIQHEGTLRRQPIELITNTECVNFLPTNNSFLMKEKTDDENSNNSTSINIQENNCITDILTHCSPTSDYETDSVDKDNDIITSTVNNAVIIPVTSRINILLSSSITNTTLSSSPFPSSTTPIVPVIYFLDVLATEDNKINNPTKNFLLTIGFGQNENNNKIMNETTTITTTTTTTINNTHQLQRPTWINQSSEYVEILPTIIHHEKESNNSLIQEQLYFATINQIEDDETALLIYSHRLQHGHDFGENIQEPLNSFFETSYMHLPIINEIHMLETSFHTEFPLFHPPDSLPHILSVKIQDDEIILPNEYEIKQQELLCYGQIHDLSDDEEDIQLISLKYDQSTSLEHYHIQPLYSFSEICYAEIIQPNYIIKNNDNDDLLSTIVTRKYENDYELNQYDQTDLMLQKAINNQIDHENWKLEIPTSTKSFKIRPPASTETGPIYEDVSMKKTVDVNMGTNGQYKQQATYNYGSEKDLRTKQSIIERTPIVIQAPVISNPIDRKDDNIIVPETIVEHISEDEKSTSSEEAFFEEWSEEFRCRRTDEYDQNTNKLLRSIIDETSERIKSDVIKEEYKEKNVRIKRHRSYDVIREVNRIVPSPTIIPINQIQTRRYEEIRQPPPISSSTLPISMTMSSSSPSLLQDRQWTTEDTYTAEIAYDSNLAKNIESRKEKFDLSSKNYDHVRPSRYSPIPPTTQAMITTVPSSNYERISTIVTPTTLNYPDIRKQEYEDVVSEEYHVEIETPKVREETSEEDLTDNYITTNQTSPSRRDSDWRNRLRQIYAPTSDDDRFDQYKEYTSGNYTAQRVSVIPSYPQQRYKEVPIDVRERNRTYFDQRKFTSTPSSQHPTKEIVISVPRRSPFGKKYHYSSTDEYEQRKKRVHFVDSGAREKVISTSSVDDDDDRQQSLKYRSSSTLDENRKQYEPIISRTDRPTFGRVGELKNAFETTRNEFTKDDNTSKYQTSITTGLTEQRRKIFEEREPTNKDHARRSINEFDTNERRMSETHTSPSIVTDHLSHIDSIESKSTSRIQPSDRLGKTEFDAITSKLESSIAKTLPQTTIDIQIRKKQGTSSTIDSDLNRLSQTNYQTTLKSTKQKHIEDAGHESEDELSDPKQNYDTRRHISKARLRDFSQSTSQPVDTNLTVQRTTTKFNERNMENILSHVPISKGKGILVELASNLSPSPTKSIHEQPKSNLTTDSGIYEYSTTTSQQLRTSSPSWRNNVSTSIIDDATRTYENGVHIDSTTTSTSSPYVRREQISDGDQTTIQNIDDSISRSTYKYNTEITSNEPINTHHQQRIVRRQLISSKPDDYENLSNYQSGIDKQNKIPITTQSRSRKPLVVDEIETIETETHVECQVQRTNEIKESTKTERISSPISSPKKITTAISHSTYSPSDEITPTKRKLVNERPQYYESTKTTADSSIHEAIPVRIEETWFKPIEREQSQENLRLSPSTRTNNISTHTMEVTSLSPQNQITFGKHSTNEIVAIVRVPELTNDINTTTTPIRHGISEPELHEKVKQDDGRSRLHYQRVHATSYLPPSTSQQYRQRQNRSRIGPSGTKHDHSSSIDFPARSSSYHASLHDQNQQRQQQQSYSPSSKLTYHPQTKYHSGSLGNLDFEIEIEKRPPQTIQQPTVVSLDQNSRAIVTTSKDGRVSIQNISARPGNIVTINSDFHSSDRSLNRSSGYFSSDEFRCQGLNTNYSSDEQSNSPYQTYSSQYYPKQSYNFDQVNELVHNYSQPPNNLNRFNETIDQIDALYNNLDVQTNDQKYKFSKPITTKNRRKELSKNSNDYSTRYTSTGFQHIPYEQQTISNNNNNNNNNNTQNWTSSSSLTNLVMSTPIRPSKSLSSSGIVADYETPNSISLNSGYGSTQNMIVYQNRLNDQSQIVQRNRTSVKQVKQKNAAKKKSGLTQGHYSDDDDDDNDSPLSDHGGLEQRSQPSSRLYNFNNYHQ